jgi:formate dehydrogenase subunit gamma
MSTLLRTFRLLVALVALCGLALIATPAMTPASAQQPSTVNPTKDAVQEEDLLNKMRIIDGRGSIPDVKSYNLEQPRGRDWRSFQDVTLPWIGAIAILGMLALLVVFYLIRGMVKIEAGRAGRTIVRFTAFERFIHWMTATCFVILAITGLNITFGRKLLLPLMSPDAFTAWSQAGKYAHNFLSFPFTLGVVLILLTWIAWNIPNREDIVWLRKGGGLMGHEHVPAGHFNAGQKAIYWIVVLGGGAMAATGYMLMFPFALTDVAGMQNTAMVHGIVAVLFVAIMIAHAYIGTVGMEGAFEAMGTGTVDLNWAKQHHSTWVEQEVAKGRGAAPPSGAAATPAE